MGNRRFRLSNIIHTSFWLASTRKSAAPESQESLVTRPQQPQHCAKPQESISNKSLPAHSFDEMLLLSSSSRSFRTDHALTPLSLAQPPHPSVYKSSNSDDSPRRRKVHSSRCCCHGVRLRQKSPRINRINNERRNASSSSSSGSGSKKRRGLSETSVMVVKSSANPERDFKESMMEMVVENNITDLDGLEELLVSYLMLNYDEFHEVIVSVFKEIVIGLFAKPKNSLV